MYASATRRVVRRLSSRFTGLARGRPSARLVLTACAVLCAAPASASATQTTFDPSETCVMINYPPEPCDGETDPIAGINDQGYQWHSLLKFDPSSIPSAATVHKATLRLYQTAESGGGSLLEVKEVAHAWGARWTDWTTPGGDFSSALEGVTPNGVGEWTEVDVTTLARNWVSSALSNNGVALTIPDATAQEPYVVEFSEAELVVDYSDLRCPSNPFAAAQTSTEGPVHAWNQYLLELIRTETPPSIRLSPTWSSRAAAMLNVGIYDTLNSVYFAKLEDLATGTPTTEVCGWQSYLTLAETDPDTNGNLAAGYAAKAILSSLYPHKATAITTEFNAIHGTPSLDQDAFDLGSYVATRVLNARSADGAGASMSYTPASTTPGAWRPSPTSSTQAGCSAAVTPQWGNVTPFTLSAPVPHSGPGGFSSLSLLLSSSYYAAQVNEVKAKGAVNASQTDRSDDEEASAWFWANDLDGTYKPPGQLIDHTRLVVETQPAAQTSGAAKDFLTTWSRQGIRVARLYAEVSLAMADGAISAWNLKYNTAIDLWRPIDAIQQADTDGTLATVKDAAWEPLSRDESELQFSPCFPAWVSGHATFGGAWSRTMENEFAEVTHSNPFPLELTTEDPHAVASARSFDSFAEAGEENADSRIFLGVHYGVDAEDGLSVGRTVADHVDGTRLRARQACAGWACATAIP